MAGMERKRRQENKGDKNRRTKGRVEKENGE